ncbi:olfactory receptor 13D1-like [Protopterus annectens]|uniref:olfactory receptor 13D1-like n=1 Tax=Protopterus annectens TaxID=7888 RepID=UPI001CF96844|nr:olfactory receptor 13D1-like [Protopterus annectens]
MVIYNATKSHVTEFILTGSPSLQVYQDTAFVGFLILYLIVLTGNASLIIAVVTDRNLHRPMYYFIANLAILDIIFTTTTVPKILLIFLQKENSISFTACFLQIVSYYTVGVYESLLLLVMSFDRYVAICNPLKYMSIITKKFCCQATVVCCILSFLLIVSQAIITAEFPFCGENKIGQLFCDYYFIIGLICADTYAITLCATCGSIVSACIPFSLVLYSYIKIFKSVIKVSSAENHHKAMSTCISHLLVVIIFYLSIIVGYIANNADNDSGEFRAITFIFHGIIAPALNPIIYALRNKEVRKALKKFVVRYSLVEGIANRK